MTFNEDSQYGSKRDSLSHESLIGTGIWAKNTFWVQTNFRIGDRVTHFLKSYRWKQCCIIALSLLLSALLPVMLSIFVSSFVITSTPSALAPKETLKKIFYDN